MEVQEIFIASPETQEQANALKAIAKAFKMKFGFFEGKPGIAKTMAEKPYDQEFVEMVLEAGKEIKNGKGHKMSAEEFDRLWK